MNRTSSADAAAAREQGSLARRDRCQRLRASGCRNAPTLRRRTRGIHTHGDGLIHIHPFLSRAAGQERDGRPVLQARRLEGELRTRSRSGTATTHKNGDKCGDKPATVRWEAERQAAVRDRSRDYKPAERRRHRARAPAEGRRRSATPPSASELAAPSDLNRRRVAPPIRRRPARRRRTDHRRPATPDADHGTDDRRRHRRHTSASTTDESGRPRRRGGDPAASADAHDAEAAAADREPGAPRTPARVARRARRRRGRALDGLPAGRVPRALRAATAPATTCSATSRCATRSRTNRSAPPVRSGSRPKGSTSASSSATATCSPTSTSARWCASTTSGAREATISLTQVEDPSAFGVVPTQRRRSGDRVRREAAAGQGAEQLDQRRHLRARAARSSIASRRGSTCRSSARRSRACSPEPGWSVRLRRRRLLARHRHAREVPAGARRRARRPARAAARARSARAGARASGCRVTCTIDAGARVEAPVLLGDGARIEAGATVSDVGDRRRRGRRSRRAGRPARCCTRASASSHGSRGARLGRRPGRACSRPDVALRERDDRRRRRHGAGRDSHLRRARSRRCTA